MKHVRKDGGFTLIELMVVIAIIATLAGLGMATIPGKIREGHKIKSLDNLKQLGEALRLYEMSNRSLPRADGAAFLLAVYGRQLDRNIKSAEIYFCPSTKREAPGDLDLTPENIDYTGPDLSALASRRNGLSMSELNAAVKGIAGNKIPARDSAQSDEEIRDNLPHAGKGVCVLYLDGSIGWVDAAEFADDIPVYGPESPKDSLKLLKPGFDG